MNVVLAFALLAGLFMLHYPKLAGATQAATVGYVKPGSPAARAGLQEGDVWCSRGQADPTWEDVALREVVSANRLLPLLVERNGRLLHIAVMPEAEPASGLGSAGWIPQTDIEVGGFIPGMDAEARPAQGRPTHEHRRRAHPHGTKVHEILSRSNGQPVHLVCAARPVAEMDFTHPRRLAGQPSWMLGVELAPRVVYVRLRPRRSPAGVRPAESPAAPR